MFEKFKFNKGKQIRALKQSLIEKDRRIHELNNDLAQYKRKFEDAQQYIETIPNDCVKGQYCRACEFAKVYHLCRYDTYGRSYIDDIVYICGKGKSCPSFVAKQNMEEP